MHPPETQEQSNPIEQKKSQSIDWVRVAIQLAARNDVLSLKILEKLYITPGHPFILDELLRVVIKPPDRKKKMTIWRRIMFLQSLGLVEIVKGKPMCIWPTRRIEKQNIAHLLKLCYAKMFGDLHVQS